jgi:PAS domain S-box-containing protein
VKPAKATKRTSAGEAHSKPGSPKARAEARRTTGDRPLEEGLRQREERLQLILDAADVGTWDWDIATGRVEWSENMERIHGQPPGSFGGSFDSFLQAVHPDDRATVLAAVEKALRGGGRYEIEYRQVGAGGQTRWMGGRGRTVCDESGQPARMIGICGDITGRKETEEQLKIVRAELETRVARRTFEAAQLNEVLREKARLLEIAHDGIIVCSVSGSILFWNRGAELMYGWPAGEALGKSTQALLQTRFLGAFEDIVSKLVERGGWEGELIHTRRDGTEIIVSSRQVLQRNDEGRPVSILEINRDITEHKKADLAHRESEARLRALVEATDDAVFEFDEQGTYLNIWTTNEGLLARPREELLGRALSEVLGAEAAAPFLQAFDRVLSTGRSEGLEYSLEFPGGTRWFLGRISRLNPVGDTGRLCLCVREITDSKQAEAELRQSAERFRLVVQAVRDYAIFMLDPEGRILTWNEGAQRLKGYSPDEIIGRSFSVFYPPRDVAAGKPERMLKAAAAEGRVEDEGWRVRKDGSRFWADVVITALRDESGNLRGFAKITRDMTERRRAEEAVRELSGRLLRLQDEERRRMARELHDSTAQTLSALSLNLALVKQRAGSFFDARASKSFEEALHLADQASREIRTFSYLLHPPMLDEAGLPYALRWYVDGFVDRTKIQVDLEASEDLGRLPSDVETALFRIVQECLTNIHRHSGSRTARIQVRHEDHQVRLEVADTGKGLPEGFFQEGNGRPATLGVGIRGMHERVRQLGGWIEVKSGQPGTIVEVALPLPEKTE